MSTKKIMDELRSFQSHSVFNPYTDICGEHDLENASSIRTTNLTSIFSRLAKLDIDSFWIGRDLGHKGGRRTGIAFTDESNLKIASKLWDVELSRATKGKIQAERTAANIWRYLDIVDENILTWNVFPFHSHEPENQYTNRSHNARERDFGLTILEELVASLKPNKLVGIGNDAFSCAQRIFPKSKVFKIRHPSYGGEREFREQLSALYNVSQEKNKERTEQIEIL